MNRRTKFYLITLGFLLSTVFSVNALRGTSSAVVDNTPDCDTVAIIKCGAFTEAGLLNKYDTNAYGDLPKVFGAFGISRADIAAGGFVNGIVWRDGRVTVGDKTVAKGAMTAGRNYGGTPIPGTNGAGKYPTSKFVTEGQTAFVKMVNGKFQFAIIKSCGNPVSANPETQPEPVYSCDSLNKNKISRTEFQFNATATAKNGAKHTGFVFDFGDGSSKRTDNNTIKHTYSKPGDYTVRATALFTVDGKEVRDTGKNCVVTVTVQPTSGTPSVSITKTVEGKEHYATTIDTVFRYQIKVTNTGEVELKNLVVTDRPEAGVTLLSVDGNRGTITNNVWKYTIPSLAPGQSMDFTLTAKVPTVKAGSIKNTVCVDTPTIPGAPDDCDDATVEVPVPGEVIVCNPATGEIISVPEADKDKYLPRDDDACKPVLGTTTSTPAAPSTVAATGPAAVLGGLFGSSALGYGAYSFMQSRRALLRKLMSVR